MKALVLIAILLASPMASAAASNQGCKSSGNQAAGCQPTGGNATGGNATATGGVGIGVGVGHGGHARVDSRNSNSNKNTNTNKNSNENWNSNANINENTAHGGSASNSLTITNPDNVTVKSVGVAPDVLTSPTAPCRIAVGASVGFLGGAFGASGSALDQGCHLRETSRHLFNLGLKEEAILVMCEDEAARKALGARCPNKPATEYVPEPGA